ncbi:UDP-2,4-diacetamido-2,4,6-trideoxy-beta-L-altropyranose hydrolase [Heyndrickxia ginsengihumi]|uniref:UDP-2,4-diacetamido-2,4, 6-trideoxy-beta-L-altropyranose hydrolase n=1 Tax=Heyndrickxia ginsengihumi TaxID=363870 RepID=UPI00203FA748|nr:UDP-2,4-diacetamido-2,4,6-trideoxy-beta-L-altropyranose hydrolase [Heyndrickxia ginsengihumi]MCM3024004.1 UDP-2,4-diacetamido-2,4,6-trideoxy-beta-L-altropyranose hydrolase [Heyndrickxia ginsengihumi]
MNIVIRTDSSVEIGTGHVMRCLTLAKQLMQFGANVSFICRDFPGNNSSYIKEQGFSVYKLRSRCTEHHWQWVKEYWETDVEETLAILNGFNQKPHLLIVDHYGLDSRWEDKLRAHVKNIMVIDDLADRPHNCDVLLDQNYYLNMRDRYRALVPDACFQLLGPNYVLLRDEFLSIDTENIQRDGKIHNVLVFFGGTDPTAETMKTLQALHELHFPSLAIHVVVGATNPNKKQIKDVCAKMPQTFYYCQIDHMADLMMKTDLAIGAGGTTTWERCYLQLPSLTAIIADNQVEVTKAVAAKGATISLGRTNEFDKVTIKKEMISLIKNKERLREMSENCKGIVDGSIVKGRPVARFVMELCL